MDNKRIWRYSSQYRTDNSGGASYVNAAGRGVSACIDHIRRNNRRIYRYSGTLYRQKQSPFQACRAMG